MDGEKEEGQKGGSVPAQATSVGASTALRQRIVGFVCDRTWVHLLFFSSLVAVAGNSSLSLLFSHSFTSLVALAMTLLVLGTSARKRPFRILSRFFIYPAIVTCVIGTAFLAVASLSSAAGMVLMVASGVATGIGSGVLFMGWMRLFFDRGVASAMREFTTAVALSFAIAIAIMLLPTVVVSCVLCVLPVFSGVFLRKSACARREAEKKDSSEGAPAKNPSRHRVIAGSALFGFVLGFCNVLCGASTRLAGPIANSLLLISGLVASAVMLALFRTWERKKILAAHRLALLLTAMGCVLVASSNQSGSVANMLTYAGMTCLAATLTAIAFFAARGVGDCLRLTGWMFALLYIGEAAGIAIATAIQAVMGDAMPVSAIGFSLTVVIIVAYLFLFTESDLIRLAPTREVAPVVHEGSSSASEADSTPSSTIAQTQPQPEPREPVSEVIARTYKLSPRESEILPLLLQGRTIARIQEELFISASTVNTHIRHIYQKCGVDNKQGLLDLVEKIDAERGRLD